MDHANTDDSLIATVEHAARLHRKQVTLAAQRKEAMAVAASLAARCSAAAIERAIAISRESDCPGRQPLMHALVRAETLAGPTFKDRHSRKPWPTGPCVYLLYDKARDLIYIGSTKALATRMQGHSKRPWVRCEWILCDSIGAAKQLEADLIFQHQPRQNVTGRNRRLWVA